MYTYTRMYIFTLTYTHALPILCYSSFPACDFFAELALPIRELLTSVESGRNRFWGFRIRIGSSELFCLQRFVRDSENKSSRTVTNGLTDVNKPRVGSKVILLQGYMCTYICPLRDR